MIQVEIRWPINPFRGDRFAEGWLPAAELALDYGATEWSLMRNMDGRLDFVQRALFPSKAHWERYWYSERMAEYRIQMAGCYQVPILPTYWEVIGTGEAEVSPAPAVPS